DLFTEADIRFTTKGKTLYAITLRPPTQPIRILSLGKNSRFIGSAVKSVRMLGHKKPLQWQQTNDALVVQIPPQLPSLYGSSLKIEFQ
ncbi:MAG TPA: alpha-L-fucosidase C-terminal domain-containing protein, partial [Marinagarivorans sp.]|nr:alpha-L-fucosidase C-terminal domain-containing protein [Marinagarivorans sp.]